MALWNWILIAAADDLVVRLTSMRRRRRSRGHQKPKHLADWQTALLLTL